ncbi:hypothetical protein [Aureimonas leprariae]|uniref:Lipoprotein n=1 Tax=Plantimonas leprariae TaxID=2615207 RepID=A0A7V7PME5_9HYPH|nr:hypothetical protein [Aureimonas leprariae]KAB0678105.1 hypothetical protein F6X38_16925 [Aureimonas leprariae]
MKLTTLLRSALAGLAALLSAGCIDTGYDRGYYDHHRRVYRDDYDRGYRRVDYYNARRPYYRRYDRPASYNRSQDFLRRNNAFDRGSLDRDRGYGSGSGQFGSRSGFRPRIRIDRSN